MKTEDLIRTLTADHATDVRPVGEWLPIAMLIAAPFSVAFFMAVLGVRPDVSAAMHNPFFDIKFIVTLSLAGPAIAIALRLARPDATLEGVAWWLLLPAGIISAAIAGEVSMPHQRPWFARLVGSNARICLSAIPAMSVPLLAGALFALRQGAPTRPRLAGAFAGLTAASLAATLYAAHCTDDSPLFVVTWYPLAMAIVVAVGVLVGPRVLRF